MPDGCGGYELSIVCPLALSCSIDSPFILDTSRSALSFGALACISVSRETGGGGGGGGGREERERERERKGGVVEGAREGERGTDRDT